jgi:hypothetical protein
VSVPRCKSLIRIYRYRYKLFDFSLRSLSAAGDTQNEVNNPEETDFAYEQDDAVAGANLQVLMTMRDHEKELIENNMEHLISHTSKSNLESVVRALSDCIPEQQKEFFEVTLINFVFCFFLYQFTESFI